MFKRRYSKMNDTYIQIVFKIEYYMALRFHAQVIFWLPSKSLSTHFHFHYGEDTRIDIIVHCDEFVPVND